MKKAECASQINAEPGFESQSIKDPFQSLKSCKSRVSSKLRVMNKEKTVARTNFKKATLLLKKSINIRSTLKKISDRAQQLRVGACTGNIKFIGQTQISMINDACYFPKTEEEERVQAQNKFEKLLRGCFRHLQVYMTKTCNLLPFANFFCQRVSRTLKEKMRIPVIKPNAKFKFFWDCLEALISLFMILIVSLSLCLSLKISSIFKICGVLIGGNLSLLYVFVILSFFFYSFSIIIKFNMAFYNKGELIEKKRQIRRHYLKGAFLFDAISLLPIALFLLTQDPRKPDSSAGIEGILIFIKLKDVFHILQKLENHLSTDEISDAIFSLGNLLITVLLINHFIACVWCSLVHDENKRTWASDLQINWKDQDYWMEIYFKAFYWALTTILTLGYGDIVPRNSLETGISMIVMVTGSAVVGYSINKIGLVLENINRRNRALRKIMNLVNHYMNKNSIPFDLQGRIREYMEFSFNQETQVDVQAEQILAERLNKNLISEVKSKIHGDIFDSFPLFCQNFKPNVLREMSQHMKPAYFRPAEVILEKERMGQNNLYIVKDGKVCLEHARKKPNEKNHIIRKDLVLTKGSCFGEYSFFTDQAPLETYRSLNYSTLIYISREDFLSVLRKSQSDYEKFCEIRDKLFQNNFSALKRQCVSCGQLDHLTSFCPSFKYMPKKLFVIAKHLFSPPQKRKKFKRCRKKDFLSSLPNNQRNKEQCLNARTVYSNTIDDSMLSSSFMSDEVCNMTGRSKSSRTEKLAEEEKRAEEEDSNDPMFIAKESTGHEVPKIEMNATTFMGSQNSRPFSLHQVEEGLRDEGATFQKPSRTLEIEQNSSNLLLAKEYEGEPKSASNIASRRKPRASKIFKVPILEKQKSNLGSSQPPPVLVEVGASENQTNENETFDAAKKDFFHGDMDSINFSGNYFPEYNAEVVLMKLKRDYLKCLKKKTCKSRISIFNNHKKESTNESNC